MTDELFDEIKDLIEEKVSDYFNSHCTRDDFDGEYDRHEYLEGLSDGTGDIDQVQEVILDQVLAELDPEILDFLYKEDIDYINEEISNAIINEADYYLM